MDGTVTRFNLDFTQARRRVLQDLEAMKLRTPEMSEQMSIYLMLKRLKETLDKDTFLKIRRKFYDILQEMEVGAAQEVELYPGALETLRKLRTYQVKIGLVTNNGRAGTETTFRRLALSEFFDVVVTRDDCEEMKPDPGPVRKALRSVRVHPQDAMLVGDGLMDIRAAKAAGLSSVAVSTGPFPRERLLEAQPDYLLNSINDLPTLLEHMSN